MSENIQLMLIATSIRRNVFKPTKLANLDRSDVIDSNILESFKNNVQKLLVETKGAESDITYSFILGDNEINSEGTLHRKRQLEGIVISQKKQIESQEKEIQELKDTIVDLVKSNSKKPTVKMSP